MSADTGRSDRGVHVIDGAKGDGVEAAGGRHGFDAGGPDFSRQVESADDFAEEGGFLALRFGEGHRQVGAEELDGDSRKAGAGAEVEQCGARA